MSNHFVSYFIGIVISNMNCLIVLFKLLFLQFMLIYNYFRENLNYMAQNNMQSQFETIFIAFHAKAILKILLSVQDILVYFDTLKSCKTRQGWNPRNNNDLALFMT